MSVMYLLNNRVVWFLKIKWTHVLVKVQSGQYVVGTNDELTVCLDPRVRDFFLEAQSTYLMLVEPRNYKYEQAWKLLQRNLRLQRYCGD